MQKWHREETVTSDKKLNEYVLIEEITQLLGINIPVFYTPLKEVERFRDSLTIKHLKEVETFKDFDRKRKNLKIRLKKV